MRGAVVTGLIFILVMLMAPSASACSLAGVPKEPARMWIWDLEEARVLDHVDTWTRGLGSMCELQKPVDLDGERLVYADRAGDSMGVWMHTIGDERPRLVFRLDGDYRSLDLDGDRLSVYMETARYDLHAAYGVVRFSHVFTIDVATGAAERADLEIDRHGDPQIEDGFLYWWTVDPGDPHHRLNVYDLHEDAWVYENISRSDTFGLDKWSRLLAMNREWIVLDDQGDTYAWDRDAETLDAIAPLIERRVALDGDLAYQYDRNGGGIEVVPLPDGEVQTMPKPDHPFMEDMAIEDGRAVLGVYAYRGEGSAAGTPPSWMRDPTLSKDFDIPTEWRHDLDPPWYLNLPSVHHLLVALAALAAARFRASRSDR